MSLREEVTRYEQLTGESAEHIPIIKIGAFLDGVDKGIDEIEKIREEIENDQEQMANEKDFGKYYGMGWAIRIIDKHISELKGEQDNEDRVN